MPPPAAVHPPIRSLADVERLERVPLAERIGAGDFSAALREGCERDPAKTALWFVPDGDVRATPERVTHGELLAAARRAAASYRSLGVGPNDPVALVLPTLPATYAALVGAFFAGIAFPVNWMLRPAHLADLLGAVRPRVIVALGPTPGFSIWEGLESIRASLGEDVHVLSVPGPGGRVLPDSDFATRCAAHGPVAAEVPRRATDLAAYVHSGGTTGMPKIVRITHGGLCYRRWVTDCTLAHQSDEVMLADTPLFHIGGLCVRGMPPIAGGMTAVIPSVLGARDPVFMRNYWAFIERYRITRLSGVPTTLSVLLKNPPAGEDLSSLRGCFATGSTAVPLAVQHGIEAMTGARALVMYGLTENTANVTLDPRDGPATEGCSGIRVPYTHIRVVRLRGGTTIERDCAPDEPGMILVKGPGITPGYLDARRDAEAFTADGWFVSGDLGRIDADGYLRVTGRQKDLILRGGHNIEPALIEEPLAHHPEVVHAAAVGKPDAHAGELPIAYVQLVPDAASTPESLIAHVSAAIAERAAIPKEIVVLEAMPLSGVGKPLKSVLRVDAARRALEAALAGHDCRVEVIDDPGVGLRAQVRIGSPAVRAPIDAILRHYTVAYAIEEETP